MNHVLTILGNSSFSMKSSAVLNYMQNLLRRRGLHDDILAVRSLPPDDLLYPHLDSPAIQEATLALDAAQGIIIATPICRASYTGLLKAFLDVLPQNALCGKAVLPLAIGGSVSQFPVLDISLHQVLTALGAHSILRGVYMTDAQIQFEHGGALHLEETIAQRLQASVEELANRVRWSPSSPEITAKEVDIYVESKGAAYNPEPAYLWEGFER